MKNILKLGIIAFAFGLIFVCADTANAQSWEKRREARREYRRDQNEARRDYRRRVNNGDYRKARREYREDMRDARRDYRRSTNRNYRGRYNNGRGYIYGRGYYNRGYIRSGRIYRRW
ncbi:MAG: hypothetical protein JSS81_08175 [Acidobacteria bacterium]|nr:hypothetical protein [Acidobacteriota bacterium]